MGLILILAGILIWLFLSTIVGIVLVVLGVILLFVPYDGAYGYSRWHGRRAP